MRPWWREGSSIGPAGIRDGGRDGSFLQGETVFFCEGYDNMNE